MDDNMMRATYQAGYMDGHAAGYQKAIAEFNTHPVTYLEYRIEKLERSLRSYANGDKIKSLKAQIKSLEDRVEELELENFEKEDTIKILRQYLRNRIEQVNELRREKGVS